MQLFLMFIGGCAGSTGGGIKVIRIIILAKMAFTEMRYLTNPKGVYSIFVNSKPIRKNLELLICAESFLYFRGTVFLSLNFKRIKKAWRRPTLPP